jgi:uncharacterized membrane protein
MTAGSSFRSISTFRSMACIIAAYGVSIPVYARLSSETPAAGAIVGRGLITFLLPTAALLICLLLHVLWRRDTLQQRDPALDATYHAIVFRIVLLIVGMHGLVLTGLVAIADAPRGAPPAITALLSRAAPALFGLALASIGNLLPRLRPNLVIGIRTTGTLHDRATWMRSNRLAGNVAVAVGLIFVVSGVLLPPRSMMLSVAAAAGTIATIAIIILSHKNSTADA